MNASRRAVLGAAVAALSVTACGRGADPATAGDTSSAPLQIGALFSGATYASGFGAGLSYATNSVNRIGRRPIVVTWAVDDRDPATAVAAAEQMIARGVRVLAGGSTPEVALRLAALAAERRVLFVSGPATDDALTGINRYTFRSGRQAYQELLALRAVAGTGRDALLVAPDDAALAAATPVFGLPGVVAPRDAPGVATGPEQLIVLPGKWPAAFWESLVHDHPEVITLLGNRTTWRRYGTAATGLRWAAYYYDGADVNYASRALRTFSPGRRTDLGHPEGFVAGQMVVRALQFGPDDVDRMIAGLEGYHFASATGEHLTVRAGDHALLQPMFQAWLVPVGNGYNAITAARFEADRTAPPAVPMRQ
jgi:branched-chain amino acid transport system substrate-binding protein